MVKTYEINLDNVYLESYALRVHLHAYLRYFLLAHAVARFYPALGGVGEWSPSPPWANQVSISPIAEELEVYLGSSSPPRSRPHISHETILTMQNVHNE